MSLHECVYTLAVSSDAIYQIFLIGTFIHRNIYSFITLFIFELLFSISTSMHFYRDLNFTKNCTFLILMDVLTNCFLECKVAASAVCISLQSMLSASN